jgi:hypothetical protein
VGNGGGNRIYDVFSFIRIRSWNFDAFVKAPAGIDVRRAQVGSAQIDGTDEFSCLIWHQ